MIVIFGATGDLTRRKLIPALYSLFTQRKYNEPLACLARKNLSNAEFIKTLETDKFIENPDQLSEFLALIKYFQLDFLKPNAAKLNKFIKTASNVICYLAVSPELFPPIISIINNLNLENKKVVFEKPFGHNLKSAKELNDLITQTFTEKEIYRIDHYLGKELVQNILVFRFANTIFEQIWNKNFVNKVEITISETVGVEKRAGYYDKAGALRDMMQNHMLQLLVLTAMKPPFSMQADDIHDRKVEILNKIRATDVKVAQYDSYKQEIDNPASTTETYVALTLEIDDDKWRGVPFILRTGKKLKKRYARIDLFMNDVSCELFSSKPVYINSPNVISIRIQPDEGIAITFNAKEPGTEMNIKPVNMEFCHKCTFGNNTLEAYVLLLNEIIEGDQTLFTRWDSVKASWKFIDPIIEGKKELLIYKKNSEVF